MGVGCRWDPWSTVSRSDTLPQGLCQDSARQFQCLGLWRGWVVKLCQDMLVGSVFGIILPEFAWIHSRWLVQHNDYVAADSWTQWSVIVSDGRIFWSRQRQLQRALTTIKTSFRRLPCQSSCHLQTLPLPVATVQLYPKHRNHVWTRFWMPCWLFTTWNLKVGVEFSAVQQTFGSSKVCILWQHWSLMHWCPLLCGSIR